MEVSQIQNESAFMAQTMANKIQHQGLQVEQAQQKQEEELKLEEQNQTVSTSKLEFLSQSALNDVGITNEPTYGKDYNKIFAYLESDDAKGTSYAELSQISKEDASKLLAQNGDFGVAKLSNRLATNAIESSQNDTQKLENSRDDIIRGFEKAQDIYGGKLPEISQKTLESTLNIIDRHIEELGGHAVDITA